MKKIFTLFALMAACVFGAQTAQAAPKDEISDAKERLEAYLMMAGPWAMVMPPLKMAEFQSSLETADAVYESPIATVDEVNAQITNLETLMAPYGPDVLFVLKMNLTSLDELIVNEDDEAQQKIVDDAKAKQSALEWDSSKSCYENYMNLYSIYTDAEAAIVAIAKYYYQVIDKTAQTLTFYYNNGYDESNPNHTGKNWDWDSKNIKKVIIDESMKEAKLTSFASMFYGYGGNELVNVESITGLENLNMEKVESMSSMFEGCKSLKSLDLSHFDTKNVESMYYMFKDCESLESINLSGFNTGNVVTMERMFEGCKSLKSLDLSSLDTKNVTDMEGMFSGCESLETINLTGFNVEKVTDIVEMFYDCKELTTIYCETDMSGVANSAYMFDGCVKLKGGKGTTYDAEHKRGEYARLDGKNGNPGYFSSGKKIYAVKDGTNMILYFDNKIDTHDGVISAWTEKNGMSGVAKATREAITKVKCDDSMKEARPVSTESWFYGLTKVTEIDLANLNTGDVTTMGKMFQDCAELTDLDVSKFDTKNVKLMGRMFQGCAALTDLDVSKFNTEKVENMAYMFRGCAALNELDLKNFATENVGDMKYMFYECNNLQVLDLGSFDTKKVENMSYMFYKCEKLQVVDISLFDFGFADEAKNMFNGCSMLVTIYCNKDVNDNIWIETDNMFAGCTALKGENGTEFNSEKINGAYARPDEGSAKPGYFSKRVYTPEEIAAAKKELLQWITVAQSIADALTESGETATAALVQDAVNDATSVYEDSNAAMADIKTAINGFKTTAQTYSSALLAFLKASYKSLLEALLTGGDSDACKQIVKDAAAAVDGQNWDGDSSFVRSFLAMKQALDGILAQAETDLTTQRATETATGLVESQSVEGQKSKVESGSKVIRNGQLLIIRNGKTYNAQGAVVR